MIDATKMNDDDLQALITEMRIQANHAEAHSDIPQVYIEWQRSLASRLETIALHRPNLDDEPDFNPLEERWTGRANDTE